MGLNRLFISNFKAITEVTLRPSSLDVFVGANGSGKTSVFELLLFIRESLSNDIPPGIIKKNSSQSIFHGGANHFSWNVSLSEADRSSLGYSCFISGPEWAPTAHEEVAFHSTTATSVETINLLEFDSTVGFIKGRDEDKTSAPISKRKNQLGFSFVTQQADARLFHLAESIRAWSFFSSFSLNDRDIRRPATLEQGPFLYDDCSNLSSVLHYYMTEHVTVFKDVQQCLRQTIPGFERFNVKAYGAPGQVMVFWNERGQRKDLSLADLSDGMLRLLCWYTLLLHPTPPPLICIDEPDLGIHPKALPLLAALIKKASARTQIFVATHNSYFLSQFDLHNVVVFRKDNGQIKTHRPGDSKTLVELLEQFGQGDLSAMHISEELEVL